MAPEQVFPVRFDAGQMPVYRSDQRADVFALGLLLYYLLTGRKTAFAQATEALLRDEPDALCQITPADFSRYAFGDEERRQLCLAEADRSVPSVVPSSGGTWMPECYGRPEKWPNFETACSAFKPSQAMGIEAVFPLLQRLLAPHPNHRLGSATDVLAMLESIMRFG